MNRESDLTIAFTKWNEKKTELEGTHQTAEQYQRLIEQERIAEQRLKTAQSNYSKDYAEKVATVHHMKSRMELLGNANCIDIERATCRFLADAMDAKAQYEPMLEESRTWKASELLKIADLETEYAAAQKAVIDLGFNPLFPRELQTAINQLERKALEYQGLGAVRAQLLATQETLSVVCNDLAEKKVALQALRVTEGDLVAELVRLAEAATLYAVNKQQLSMAKQWLDMEKQLPVAKERKTTAEARLLELDASIVEHDTDIFFKNGEWHKELLSASGKEHEEQTLKEIGEIITSTQGKCDSLQMQIGSLTNQLEVMAKDRTKMDELSQSVSALSRNASILEILKQAFSPDGIPHNIIRSMLPMITATANNILGQMTGGKMGMEFRTEKVLKSNNKKEVVTLDIFIEEYGKPTLPYASKSGGEKVKSALSAILALAETKTTSAGIRLGMLFIDEPPFLDSDGIQAYCDALETIGLRYSDIKIMAITHDPTMKARFPQNVDVIKTDNGSKVIFE